VISRLALYAMQEPSSDPSDGEIKKFTIMPGRSYLILICFIRGVDCSSRGAGANGGSWGG
jgi:hypothetical protein